MQFKLQWPLASSDPDPKVLVYDRSRSIVSQIPIDDEVRMLFKPGQVKVYVHGNMRRDGKLMVDTVIAGGEDW